MTVMGPHSTDSSIVTYADTSLHLASSQRCHNHHVTSLVGRLFSLHASSNIEMSLADYPAVASRYADIYGKANGLQLVPQSFIRNSLRVMALITFIHL